MRRLRFWGVSLLLGATLIAPVPARATTSLQYSVGTGVTMHSTDINTTASNAYSAYSASIYDNRIGQNGGGATRCRVQVHVTFAAAPTANTQIIVWLYKSTDGTTFEPRADGTVTPGSALQLSFPVNSGTGSTTTHGIQDIDCPPGYIKTNLKNEGGQNFTGTTNTVIIFPVTLQGN